MNGLRALGLAQEWECAPATLSLRPRAGIPWKWLVWGVAILGALIADMVMSDDGESQDAEESSPAIVRI